MGRKGVSCPNKRVGSGVWGEGRDLRSLALPRKNLFNALLEVCHGLPTPGDSEPQR